MLLAKRVWTEAFFLFAAALTRLDLLASSSGLPQRRTSSIYANSGSIHEQMLAASTSPSSLFISMANFTKAIEQWT